MIGLSVLAIGSLGAIPSAGQSSATATYTPPCTRDGHPDVQGPRITCMPYPFRIVQQPGVVIMLGTNLHRVIPTDGRPHIGEGFSPELVMVTFEIPRGVKTP